MTAAPENQGWWVWMGRPDVGPDHLLMVLTEIGKIQPEHPAASEGAMVMMPLWGPTKEAAIEKGTLAAMVARDMGVVAVLVEFRWHRIDLDHTDAEIVEHPDG